MTKQTLKHCQERYDNQLPEEQCQCERNIEQAIKSLRHEFDRLNKQDKPCKQS